MTRLYVLLFRSTRYLLLFTLLNAYEWVGSMIAAGYTALITFSIILYFTQTWNVIIIEKIYVTYTDVTQ